MNENQWHEDSLLKHNDKHAKDLGIISEYYLIELRHIRKFLRMTTLRTNIQPVSLGYDITLMMERKPVS